MEKAGSPIGVAGTRERVLDSGRHLLQTEGAEAVTMRRVAEMVGVTPMAIYHYFENREALMAAVAEAEFVWVRERLLELRGAHDDEAPKERFARACFEFVDLALERPRVFSFLFMERRLDARQFPSGFADSRSPTLSLMADAVRELIALGAFRPDDALELSFTVWALLQGCLGLYFAGRLDGGESEVRGLCRRAIWRLIDGLAV
jgi:AcrR family transcriptional regulator